MDPGRSPTCNLYVLILHYNTGVTAVCHMDIGKTNVTATIALANRINLLLQDVLT